MELMSVRREEMKEMKRLRSCKKMTRNGPYHMVPDTHNTGCLDWKDTGMVLGARVVVPAATYQHQTTPA